MVTLRNTSFLLMGSLALLVGCAERHSAIPKSARLMAEDRASKVDFVAPDDGQVFVEDNSSNKLLYSGTMREGERLAINPIKDQITINGQMVRDQKIRDLNEVRVFFQPDPSANVAGSRTTVVQPVHVHPAEPARSSDDAQITVTPKSGNESEIRVRPGPNGDSKVTVEPGDDGSKVTIEPK
jgi:hypothetical protein